jgi:cytoskeleton protein RodZ
MNGLKALWAVLFRRTNPSLAQVEPERRGLHSAELQSAGAELRRQREELGLNLDEIAAGLRIKPVYLSAIEEGRIDGLPGAAYATGFVRAYGAYLGLDSLDISRRFKMAAARLNTKPALTFPTPSKERSRPGGGTLALASILVICAYAVWYYFGAADQSRPHRVTEVPPTLLSESLKPQPAPSAAKLPVRVAPPPSTAREATAGTATGASPLAGSHSVGSSSLVAPAVPPTGGPPTGSPEATSGFGASGGVASAASNPAPVATPGPRAASVTVVANAAPSAAPIDSSPNQAMAASGVSPQGEAARNYGAGSGQSRIVLRATADSWIEVRDAGRTVLFAGLLRPGDTYRVPDLPGLSMRAGNAGGLTAIVDGTPTANLGPIGAVRNLALDPKVLGQRGFTTRP